MLSSPKKLEKPKKLIQAANRVWAEVISRRFLFNHRKIEADVFKTLTLEDVLSYFDAYVAKDGPKRSKLSIHVRGATMRTNAVQLSVGEAALLKASSGSSSDDAGAGGVAGADGCGGGGDATAAASAAGD